MQIKRKHHSRAVVALETAASLDIHTEPRQYRAATIPSRDRKEAVFIPDVMCVISNAEH
jgi:hypothetical protein